MNFNSSPNQNHPPTNIASRAALKRLLGHAELQARHILRLEGRMQPLFFAARQDDLSIVRPGPLNEVPEKNEFAAIARLICAAHGAEVSVLALETWVLEAPPGERLDLSLRPSQSPDRREFIYLSGEALGGLCEQRLLPIRRDRRGRFSCLGTAQVFIDEPAEGRFANLLPQIPVTAEVRSFAEAMLKTKGLDRSRLFSAN